MTSRGSTTSRRAFLRTLGTGAAALAMPKRFWADEPTTTGRQGAGDKPNFIIFFTDDQGYNDVGCFGSPRIRTPHFDRMAREGMKCTSFYAQVVCGPSRAAIMTGCYPIRVAEPQNKKNPHTIVHAKEVTIAEVLEAGGYATALIGKWHLAGPRRKKYRDDLMPNAQGFDHFFGTPLHNGFTHTVQHKSFKTQLMRGRLVLTEALTQDGMDALTQRYTAEAVEFIRKNRERPFFLYLAHNMPHVPLGASKAFRGRSKRGLYGDVIEELDWSAGQIIDTLKKLGLDENSLMIFTSDNGPWVSPHLGDYGGSAAPLRGSKMMAWDGGARVPCIMRWPGRIPAGAVTDEIVTTMDLLPTFAGLAGAKLPANRTLDGRDITPLITGQSAEGPHDTFYYYVFTHLQAVRHGKWKLLLPRPARPKWTAWYQTDGKAILKPQLYDLATDTEEKHDLADHHPDVVAKLMQRVETARKDLGDYNRVGKGARFFDRDPVRPGAGKWTK